MLRIRKKSFGSGVGSGSGLQLVMNPDLNPGCGSGSESWIRIRIRNWLKLPLFVLKFLRNIIFKHKRLPSLSSVTWLRTICEINFQSTRISHIYAFCMCSVPPHANETLLNLWLDRRKIRLLEGNAKCCHLKKIGL